MQLFDQEISKATGECPQCGAPAELGIMRDEGQAKGSPRVLWCKECETRWAFPRIKCARCGNEHQDELAYFFAEGDMGHRIYGCKECKGALKVICEADLGRAVDDLRAEAESMDALWVAAHAPEE